MFLAPACPGGGDVPLSGGVSRHRAVTSDSRAAGQEGQDAHRWREPIPRQGTVPGVGGAPPTPGVLETGQVVPTRDALGRPAHGPLARHRADHAAHGRGSSGRTLTAAHGRRVPPPPTSPPQSPGRFTLRFGPTLGSAARLPEGLGPLGELGQILGEQTH